ncbi:MAG: hypothetical protein ACLUB7_13790 [Coprococcus phoceensis]
MSPKKRKTGGGQKCPLSREEQRGTKMSPKQRRTGGDKNVPGKRRYKVGRYKGRSYFDARFL